MTLRNFLKPLFVRIKRSPVVFFIIKYLLYALMRLLFMTYRLRVTLDSNINKNFSDNVGVFYFWHQQTFAASYFLMKAKAARHCIVSSSDDGRFAGAVVELFGYNAIYGSAFKNPIQVTRQALKILKDNQSFCIVGDGSRGPLFELKQGVPFLAIKANKPLFFVQSSSSWHFTFKKSWDKFQIPLPFSKINIHVSKSDPNLLRSNPSGAGSSDTCSSDTCSSDICSSGDLL
jgi:lysophospholipid acyltransferase (LPLAT)-like uncharacterized protein